MTSADDGNKRSNDVQSTFIERYKQVQRHLKLKQLETKRISDLVYVSIEHKTTDIILLE